MKRMKRLLVALSVATLAATPAAAQDKLEGTIGTDVVSSYIWRGQKAGNFSLQPTAGISYKGLSLGAWGSFAIVPSSTYQGTDEELDITLGYETGGFHVGITDYYFYNCGHPFFKYGGLGRTAHTFEGNVGYDFGFLSVNWFTNFAGNDGTGSNGKRAYSSYLQLDAPFRLAGLDWTATLGAVPYRTDFYAYDDSDGFHINQVALKAQYDIKLPHFTLPVFGQLIGNPSSRDLYYLVGFTITAL